MKTHILSAIQNQIKSSIKEDTEDAFFIADLEDIVRKHKLWTEQLPRVKPFYAVKCNDDLSVLKTLSELGTGFDCASKNEIKKVLSLKVDKNRVIYANPCKPISHIKYAAKHGIPRMTFDNEAELYKIKRHYPMSELVLRLLPPDDSKSQCQLGMKFGAPLKQVPDLLLTAKKLELNVIGISFHVGSGCYDANAFTEAVQDAHVAFTYGHELGYEFSLLDIGGGFPGQPEAPITFQAICEQLRLALDTYFPACMGIDIIAEPGRFYVASAFTLAVNIIAKRTVPTDNIGYDFNVEGRPSFMYYINDGVYGSFNCLLYDHASVKPTLPLVSADDTLYKSSIWGPTCDGLDCVMESTSLPELFVGDWLVFENMGAYTICAASSFNGMPVPKVHTLLYQQDTWWPVISEDPEVPLEILYVPGYEATDFCRKRRINLRRSISEA